MKRIAFILFVLVCLADAVWGYGEWSFEQRMAVMHGASAKLNITVVNDVGAAVSNACVTVGFGQKFNQAGGEEVRKFTDENGYTEISGRTSGNRIWIRVEKDGYYLSSTNFNYIAVENRHKVRFNHWQPYGEVYKILLRERRSPIKAVSAKGDARFFVPSENVWFGFDLLKGDLVAPYGDGEVVDLEMKVLSDQKPTMENEHIEMYVRFPGKGNGFYYEEHQPYSEWIFPYRAEVEAAYYNNEFYCYRNVSADGNVTENSPLKTKALIARIRTQKDENGNVVECYYLRINRFAMFTDMKGRSKVWLGYRLNPTPNDPNLEAM